MSELNSNRKNKSWNEVSVRQEAAKYQSKKQFKTGCQSAYTKALRMGIIDELFENQRKSWNEKSVREEAMKYNSKKEFQRSCQPAYHAAWLRFGIIDELFQNRIKSSGYWDKNSVCEEAKKYESKSDFYFGCNAAYNVALRLKIIDELFDNQHRYTDADAIYVWRVANVLIRDKILVKVGVTSKRLGDSRIKICANRNGFVVADQHMFHASNAAEIEDTILGELIDTPEIGIKDGKTEFRLIERGEYEALVERISSLVKL